MLKAEVAVADIALDAARLEGCASLLDPGERARANRFVRDADRIRFIASHAALRLVLGRALAEAPSSLRFGQEPGGRPVLLEPAGTDLDFNLSHSGAFAVIGLIHGAKIGVDVEVARPLSDALMIARSHFAADEVAALEAVSPGNRTAAFFTLWTRKEAVVKALGTGLAMPLDAFSVTVPPEAPRLRRIVGSPDDWTLADLALGHGVHATVAVTRRGCPIRASALPEDWAKGIEAK